MHSASVKSAYQQANMGEKFFFGFSLINTCVCLNTKKKILNKSPKRDIHVLKPF